MNGHPPHVPFPHRAAGPRPRPVRADTLRLVSLPVHDSTRCAQTMFTMTPTLSLTLSLSLPRTQTMFNMIEPIDDGTKRLLFLSNSQATLLASDEAQLANV